MLRDIVKKFISAQQKRSIKTQINKIKKFYINRFKSFTADDLKNKLKEIGIQETDTVMVHANFNPESGFEGTPNDVVNVLVDYLGEKGNLLMVSIPFRGKTYDYMKKYKPFKVNKTISLMGLITEMFRRRKGTLRSLHPTHPVLAYGKDAERLVADHEKCLYMCGAGSPFEKFRKLNGKILFYDVSFGAITFYHYVEDLTKDKLPFDVYHSELFKVKAFDRNNEECVIKTYVYNPEIKRSAFKLEAEMINRNLLNKYKIGNAGLILVKAEDVVTVQTNMAETGNYPYDL